MEIQVILFAGARTLAGGDAVTIDVDLPTTAGQLLACLARQHPPLERLAGVGRLAVNGRYARDGDAVAADSEVAFIPPVSGG